MPRVGNTWTDVDSAIAMEHLVEVLGERVPLRGTRCWDQCLRHVRGSLFVLGVGL